MNKAIDYKHVAKIAAILYQHASFLTVEEKENKAVEIALKIIQASQSACEKFNDEVRPA
jgi:hypothetical protein